MDNNLLKQLIAQHRRVVIPDFGAFLKKETPDGEELVFSPFLRKDDGVVTDAIVTEYGVETEDARAMVAEFVIYLRQSLASSGRYYIEGVGMLAADANGAVTLKEGEMPEPEPVVPESVPEPEPQVPPVRVQPVPQQVQQTQAGFARPVQQSAGQTMSMPGATRPQSIQVQGQPPVQQPIVPPVQQMPAQQTFPGAYPGVQQQAPAQGYAQRQGMPVQQPFQRTPPPMPQVPQQQPGPQQSMRPPMSGQMPQQSGQPVRGVQGPMVQGQPLRGGGQPPLPPSQRQPQPVAAMGGGGVPPRGPQGPNTGGRGPGMPGGSNGKPGQPQRRPGPPRRRPQKTKTDVWLIVAIVAALVVIAIMIYGFLNTGKSEIDMEMINAAMAPVQDTTTVVDPGL